MSIPDDDPERALTIADADDPALSHLAIAGGVYTILVSGDDTGGRYCLIDMIVPDGGGPPPHRHDFEEMFTLLEGELEFTFRGETSTLAQGRTVNIPANAPHAFKNISGKTVHLLCMCAPAGQDAFFKLVGDPMKSRTSPPPKLGEGDLAERGRRAAALAPRFRTEMLP